MARGYKPGEWGEQVAAAYLRSEKKFEILGVRVRVGRRDEVDIVARDGPVLVFVEVKTRRSERYGRPASAVDRAKRHALSRAAVRYVRSLRGGPTPYFRFDVVEVVGEEAHGCRAIRHIEQAFGLDPLYQLPY